MMKTNLWALVGATCLTACAPREPIDVVFGVSNLTAPGLLSDPDGQPMDLAIAPGLLAIVVDADVVFEPGAAASSELQQLAEQGNPLELLDALEGMEGVTDLDILGDRDNPDYADNPIGPGGSASLEVTVGPEEVLVVAMMLIPSNDGFLGTPAGGLDVHALSLTDPVDVTEQMRWWDAGTEQNQPLGAGDAQPAHSEPGTGDDEDGTVTAVEGSEWPALADVVEVVVRLP